MFGIFAAIGGFISKAVSVVAGAVSKIGPALKEFGSKFLSVVGEKIKTGIETVAKVVGAVANVLSNVCNILFGTKDESGELGFKAEVAEKKRENFDTPEEYLKYLDEQELTEEQKKKYANLSDEEKVGYQATGIAIQTEAVSNDLGFDISEDMLVTIGKLEAAGKLKISAKELIQVLKSLHENGVSMSAASKYLEGEPCDTIKTGDAFEKSVSQIDSIKDPEAEIAEMQETAMHYDKEGEN